MSAVEDEIIRKVRKFDESTQRRILDYMATLEQKGTIPPDVVEALGGGKRPKVHVTIKEYTYRSSIALMGGEYMIPVSEEVRKGAGVRAGTGLSRQRNTGAWRCAAKLTAPLNSRRFDGCVAAKPLVLPFTAYACRERTIY